MIVSVFKKLDNPVNRTESSVSQKYQNNTTECYAGN